MATATIPEVEPPTAAEVPTIRAVRLEVRTRWQRPNIIPGPFLANTIRGALGLTLRKLVCPEGWLNHDCHPCPLYTECAYGQVFAPTPPADAVQLRLQQDLPRPFVIEPPGLHPGDRVTPEGLTFRLMLFGDAIDRLPYFISTLDRLGHDGMGRDRIPFNIEQIATLHPAGDEVLFTHGSSVVRLPQRCITLDDLLSVPWPEERSCGQSPDPQSCGRSPDPCCGRSPDRATAPTAGLPNADEVRRRALADLGLVDEILNPQSKIGNANKGGPQLRLEFLTPLLLKSGSRMEHGRHVPAREIRDRPPLGVIVRRLRDRVSALCAFFGEPWQHPDFAAIGRMADTVALVESHTRWLTRDRRSTKTGHQHEISGLVGHAVYAFPDEETLAALAPLLKLAELVHVGKHAPWGNGAVRVGRVERGELRDES
jgi:hypothetical protein